MAVYSTNMKKVLKALEKHGPITVGQLSKHLGKSWTQTKNILEELKELNLAENISSDKVSVWFRNMEGWI